MKFRPSVLVLTALAASSAFATAKRKPAQAADADVVITLSPSDYAKIWVGNHSVGGYIGKDYPFDVATSAIEVEGQKLELSKMGLRGLTCKKAERKCISVKTKKGANTPVLNGSNPVKANDFNLISMWQDDAYISNKISYGLLNAIDLIRLKNSYAWVQVKENGQTHNEGLYLVTEKPADVLEGKYKSPFIMRRGVNDKYEIEELDTAVAGSAAFETKHKEMYTWAKKLKGKELYDKVSERLDVNQYFTWLAFNALVRNQDAQDEVFLYADPAAAKDGRLFLHVFPWDFDDTFQEPQTGALASLKKLVTREDSLDKAIAEEPLFQAKYREVTKTLLTTLNDKMIDDVASQIAQDIQPYLREEILAVSSALDKKKVEHTAEYIRGQLRKRVEEMKARRLDLLKEVS